MEAKYYGPIKAELNTQAGQAVLTCKRGPIPITDGMLAMVAAWAIDSLVNAGFEVDTSGIESYLAKTS